MSRPLEDGCACGHPWRAFRRVCACVGYPLMFLGYVVALPGLLVNVLGEFIRDLPWARRSPPGGKGGE